MGPVSGNASPGERSAGIRRRTPARSRSSPSVRRRRATARAVKIVATVGPASRRASVLRRMVAAGVNVIRLNMSHGTHEEHAEAIAAIRRIDPSIGILLDLSGPKLRTGSNRDGRPIHLRRGGRLLLTPRRVPGTEACIGVSYAGMARDLARGRRVLLDDGQLELEVLELRPPAVLCRVVVGGELGEHKGIHLPGAWVSAPAMTAKDRRDLRFGLERGVDLVALSFVRAARDVETLRRAMRRLGRPVPVVAKLETAQAIEQLDGIMAVADSVMVARGDLGLDLPPDQVPLAQKRIIARANLAGIPVITATQMLDSMTRRPRPTRAEATDVANAVIDGTDAVMLSGETAAGRYPVEAVAMMARIIDSTEASEIPARAAARRHHGGTPQAGPPGAGDAPAVAQAAAALARLTGAEALVVHTLSGATARLVARERPAVRIVALAPTAEVVRRLSVVWGVTARAVPPQRSTDRMIAAGESAVLAARLVRKGDRVVTVAGTTRLRGGTNAIQLVRVGMTAGRRSGSGATPRSAAARRRRV